MLIWRGAGILVPVLWFGIGMAMQFGIDEAFGSGTYTASGWGPTATFMISAVVTTLLGLTLNAATPVRDVETGELLLGPDDQPVQVRQNRHTFFFVPMQFWGPILVVLGVLFLAI